jgi:hypothetical protein
MFFLHALQPLQLLLMQDSYLPLCFQCILLRQRQRRRWLHCRGNVFSLSFQLRHLLVELPLHPPLLFLLLCLPHHQQLFLKFELHFSLLLLKLELLELNVLLLLVSLLLLLLLL